ncbi:MAG TPA: VOC family protein [Actinomycetes bacterium]|jgi:predicted 3-demethylubiquinone-9 3-methyltransferase (glyoxalase superfamily)
MQKIVPNLWFDTEAEEAASFYTSVFKDSAIQNVSHYGEDMPMPAGTVLTVDFTIMGQRFTALNGGPQFPFTEAVSLLIECEDQEEVDDYWEKLTSDGGQEVQCGWLKDKYGLSWQVIPTELNTLVTDPDPERAGRAMAAMMKQVKIDIAELRKAADGA